MLLLSTRIIPLVLTVANMASSSRVVFEMEDIAGHHGTLRSAMYLFVFNKGPMNYNEFQSGYFTVKRECSEVLDDEKPESETQADLQKRMKHLYRELHHENYGEDFMANVMLGRTVERLPAPKPAPAVTSVTSDEPRTT